MASLYNNKISTTYVGLIKTIDNAVISASLRELSDGSGNATGLYVNTAGDFKVTAILEWGTLKDTGEGISITKFVDEADGIASNDNDTTIPTSAAIKDYVDTKFAETDTLAEVLVFGNTTGVTKISVDSSSSGIDLVDDAKIRLGTGNDFEIYHDSATSKSIISESGASNLEIQAGNLIVKDTSDNTLSAFYAGGKNEFYFNSLKKLETTSDGVTVTGGLTATGGSVFTGATFSSNVSWADSAEAAWGADEDFTISHIAGDNYLSNDIGNLYIRQRANDGDILFQNDDGSGGTTEYFKLDGSVADGTWTYTTWVDYGTINLGNDRDLQLYHNSTDSHIINKTGDLYIKNQADDKDIIFQSDNGSGGVTTYLALDGSQTNINVQVDFRIYDNKKLQLGNGADLEIYHDGSDSYIADTGTGDLIISGSNDVIIKDSVGNLLFNGNASDSVELYYGGSKKFETTSGGIQIHSNINMNDNGHLYFGASNDLDIYHSMGLVLILQIQEQEIW